jgi:hypothetical protein
MEKEKTIISTTNYYFSNKKVRLTFHYGKVFGIVDNLDIRIFWNNFIGFSFTVFNYGISFWYNTKK